MTRFFVINDCLYNLQDLKSIECFTTWLPNDRQNTFTAIRMRIAGTNALSIITSEPLWHFKRWLSTNEVVFDFDEAIMDAMNAHDSKEFITELTTE